MCTGTYVALFVLASLYAVVELSDLIADKMHSLIVLLMMAKEKLLTLPLFYLVFDLLSLL